MSTMAYRQVGTSGLTVSATGLGCNNFGMRIDEDAARAVVHAALDAGITHFDTADIYAQGRSEEILGRVLGERRDDVVIATKFGAPTGEGPYRSGASRRYVTAACEASLRRLGTDWIDLYYLHFPDPRTPIEETLTALDDLVRAGKVRYIASSNLPAWQIADADHKARAGHGSRFVAAQVEWNLLQRRVEGETVPACRHFGVGVVPYFPLASGLLSGKYRRGEAFPEGSRLADMPYFAKVATEANLDTVERLRAYAEEHGHTLLDLAMSWLASQPGVPSVIAGATTPEQVKANAEAMSWKLDVDEVAALADPRD